MTPTPAGAFPVVSSLLPMLGMSDQGRTWQADGTGRVSADVDALSLAQAYAQPQALQVRLRTAQRCGDD